MVLALCVRLGSRTAPELRPVAVGRLALVASVRSANGSVKDAGSSVGDGINKPS